MRFRLSIGSGVRPVEAEIAARQPVVHVRLIGDGDDGPLVFHEGWFRTGRTVARTLNRITAATADWVTRAETGRLPAPPTPTPPGRSDGRAPGPLAVMSREARNLLALARDLFLIAEDWNMGIVAAPIERLLRDGLSSVPVYWFPPPPSGDFYADPHGLIGEDGRLRIVFEAYRTRLSRAELCQAVVDAPATAPEIRDFVDLGVHASFPTLVHDGTEWLCVPETFSSGRVVAIPVRENADGLEAGTPFTLLEQALTDPILFEFDGRWWLMGSDDTGHHLHAWWGSTPRGPWTSHSANPIKTDIRSARPAGPVFQFDGRWLRPAQDGSAGYGSAVVLNEILRLTPDEFVERPFARIDPDPSGPYPDGLHTFVPVGDYVLIDGKRKRIHPLALIWRLAPNGD